MFSAVTSKQFSTDGPYMTMYRVATNMSISCPFYFIRTSLSIIEFQSLQCSHPKQFHRTLCRIELPLINFYSSWGMINQCFAVMFCEHYKPWSSPELQISPQWSGVPIWVDHNKCTDQSQNQVICFSSKGLGKWKCFKVCDGTEHERL